MIHRYYVFNIAIIAIDVARFGCYQGVFHEGRSLESGQGGIELWASTAARSGHVYSLLTPN